MILGGFRVRIVSKRRLTSILGFNFLFQEIQFHRKDLPPFKVILLLPISEEYVI